MFLSGTRWPEFFPRVAGVTGTEMDSINESHATGGFRARECSRHRLVIVSDARSRQDQSEADLTLAASTI